jgi:hypothetical protein
LQQFEECTALIDRILASTNSSSEYAVYVKALIQRQRGEQCSIRDGSWYEHQPLELYAFCQSVSPVSHQQQLYCTAQQQAPHALR